MRIMFASRSEAEEVLNHLISICDLRGVATEGDLYDLAGIPKSYLRENWGWRDLRNTRVVRTSIGYVLDLPKPEDVRVSDAQVIELCNSLNERKYFAS